MNAFTEMSHVLFQLPTRQIAVCWGGGVYQVSHHMLFHVETGMPLFLEGGWEDGEVPSSPGLTGSELEAGRKREAEMRCHSFFMLWEVVVVVKACGHVGKGR